MMDCLPWIAYASFGWHNLSLGDNPSYHTLTRLIIVLLHRISYCCVIIIWCSSNWQHIPSDDPYSIHLYLFSQWSMKSSRDIIQLSHAVDITMRPNVQRLIERNVKCHVTFFRLIKFKISIWVCNNYCFHFFLQDRYYITVNHFKIIYNVRNFNFFSIFKINTTRIVTIPLTWTCWYPFICMNFIVERQHNG